MNKPKVYNKHHHNAPPDAVYIGRGSMWGNPYTHKQGTKARYIVGSREEAVAAFEAAMDDEDRALVRRELKGKNLVCFCAPLACHGDVLLRIANNEEITE